MFDHVTIRVSDRAASEHFYGTVLRPIGKAQTYADEHFAEWDDFSLAAATADRPATRRLHIGFAAPTRNHVDEFWRVGKAAGYVDDGPAGPRPQYSDDYYGAFLLDPDGNSAEAVHHRRPPRVAESTIYGSVSPTSTPRPASTTRSHRTRASSAADRRRSSPSSQASVGRSPWCAGSRPGMSTWRFRWRRMRRSTRSTAR